MLFNSAFIAIDELHLFAVGGFGDTNFQSEVGFTNTAPEIRVNPADPTFIFGNFPEGLRLLARFALGFVIPGAFVLKFLPDLTGVFVTALISFPVWYKYLMFFIQWLSNRSTKGIE